jgi:hypothetical protein
MDGRVRADLQRIAFALCSPTVAARRDAEMLQQLVRAAIELVGLRRDAAANVIAKRGALAIVDSRNERDRSETVATGHQQQLVTNAATSRGSFGAGHRVPRAGLPNDVLAVMEAPFARHGWCTIPPYDRGSFSCRATRLSMEPRPRDAVSWREMTRFDLDCAVSGSRPSDRHGGQKRRQRWRIDVGRHLRAADAGRVDVQKGVRQLTRSVKEIQLSLRRAERKIEADARGPRAQASQGCASAVGDPARDTNSDARRIVTRLGSAADSSWVTTSRTRPTARSADARKVADSTIERFRRAVSE